VQRGLGAVVREVLKSGHQKGAAAAVSGLQAMPCTLTVLCICVCLQGGAIGGVTDYQQQTLRQAFRQVATNTVSRSK